MPASAQTPHVVSTSPAQNALNVRLSTNISVTFDVDMDETTIDDSTFVVNARSTGLHAGTISYDGPSRTATFNPVEDFDEGEVVTVALTSGIESSGGVPLDSAYLWSFTSAVDDGSGTFAAHSVYPVGGAPRSVFSADLDGDGDLDLATANAISDNISVLPNNGDGTFAPHSPFETGDGPVSVFSADLDGDGDLDLATANYYSDNVSVLLNKTGTDVETTPELVPARFSLRQNYPNPFNPSTAINYSVPARCHVTITIYNLLGQRVNTILDEVKPAGKYTTYWDGRDQDGRPLATGVYLYQIKAGHLTQTKKMLLLK
jgi:hypothetical protein